jgi:pullulanase
LLNPKNLKDIEEHHKFNYIDEDKLIVDYSLKDDKKEIRIIHNFGDEDYPFKTSELNIVLNSSLKPKNDLIEKHSSIISIRKVV